MARQSQYSLREYITEGVILRDGDTDGSIDVDSDDPVYVAIVVDVMGYGPHEGAIYAVQNRYHGSEDTALQEAYEILEQWQMDHNPDHYKELIDEYGDNANEILTETFDGVTWKMSPKDFAAAIEGTKAEKYIKTYSGGVEEARRRPMVRAMVTEGGRRISARDLKPGDFIRGERGTRRYPILSVRRVGGALPIEVQVQGQGTWHFKPDDSVEVFSGHEKWSPPVQEARNPRPQSRGFIVIATKTGEVWSDLFKRREDARKALLEIVKDKNIRTPDRGYVPYENGLWFIPLGIHQVMLYPGQTYSSQTYKP